MFTSGPLSSSVLQQLYYLSYLGSLNTATTETCCKNGALNKKQSNIPFALGAKSIQTYGFF
nr:MAG TPA: hypothetical protein [Caudoviricetes sp.]